MDIKTIHIFGCGDTQIVAKDVNIDDLDSSVKKVSTSTLPSAQAVIDHVYGKKPSDNDAKKDFFAINIHLDMFADFLPEAKGEEPFRTKFEDLDKALIDSLISEIEAQ